MYGVTRRVLANRERGRLRQRRTAERFAEQVRAAPGVDDTAEAHAHTVQLVRALRQLKNSDREVLVLAAWEGLGTTEIAVVIGSTENAAAIRLHRARKRLAEAFAKERDVTGHTPSRTLRHQRPWERGASDGRT